MSFLVFISCTKEKTNDYSGIPTFESKVQLSEKINYLFSLDENERLNHEYELNQISLKTHTFNQLKSVDYDKINNIEELNREINSKSDYLSLDLDENSEYVVNVKYEKNIYSLIANKQRLFIVSDSVYKVFENGVLGTKIENIHKIKLFNPDKLSSNNGNEIFKVYIISGLDLVLKNGLPNYGKEIWRTSEGNNNRTRLFLMTNIRKNIFEGSETFEAYGEVLAWRKFGFVWTRVSRTFDGYANFYGSYTFNGGSVDFSCKGSLKTDSPQMSKKVFAKDGQTIVVQDGMEGHENIKIHGSNSWATASGNRVEIILN